MQNPKDLFDRKALSIRRQRTEHSDPSAWFLHKIAAAQVQERLKEVNRVFTKPVVISWKADFWDLELGLNARCITDAEILDLPESSADLIVHGLGLHWANDPVGQLIQMRRALRPDGLMIAVMFAGDTLTELRNAFARAEIETEGGLSPRVAPMGELRTMGGLLQRAGFALPVADTVRLDTSYKSAMHLMHELRAMGETNVIVDRRKTTLGRTTLAKLIEEMKATYPCDNNRISTTFELAFLTGWSPSETQQKPLRPGSAITSLADALKPKPE